MPAGKQVFEPGGATRDSPHQVSLVQGRLRSEFPDSILGVRPAKRAPMDMVVEGKEASARGATWPRAASLSMWGVSALPP